jgi:hypothetical protein
MNRFDAHQGFWNTTILNSTIGHSINITGGGRLYMENVTKLTGYQFLSVRGDYGASFEGDIVIKNCRHEALLPYNSTREDAPQTDDHTYSAFLVAPGIFGEPSLYYNWDFGYELYLPKTITLDNFTCGNKGDFFIYPGVKNEAIVNNYKHHHHNTEKIVYKNMSFTPFITNSEESTVLKSIPVVNE